MAEVSLRPEVAEKFKLVKAKANTQFAHAEFGCFTLADITLAQAERLVKLGFEHLKPIESKTAAGKQ